MENKLGYYAIIPANVRYDKRLTPNAKLLYGEITALCNEKGYCWASNNYFADVYNVSKTSVSKWVNQLVEFGYVTSIIQYKEGSKEVKYRHLYIATPHQENLDTPHQENLDTPPRKVNGGIQEKCKVNTTINNKLNNTINTTGEASSPSVTPSKKTSSKLFSTPEQTVDKKSSKWYDHKLDVIDEFDFSEPVQDELCNFLQLLAEMKTLLPDITIRAQLTKLKAVSGEQAQIKVVSNTVSRGWKSLDYMINDLTKSQTANFDTAKNSSNQFYTEEQKKQMREDYKNASKEDIF